MEQTTEQLPPSPPPPPPQRLTRSKQDRVIGGVAGGLGRYFGVDPIIFRIAFVVLVLAGGAGVLAYIAALLLVPEAEGEESPSAQLAQPSRDRWLMVVLVAVGLVVAAPLLAIPLLIIGVPTLIFGAIVLPFVVVALVGALVWWLVSGKRPDGAGDVARAALFGVGVLLLLSALMVGAGWAAAAGGGTVVAGLVIAAGVLLVAGAFIGGARWLILPALAIAFPLAIVSATGFDLDGGVGDRSYRPGTTAEIRDNYQLGIGSMKIDLRDVAFAQGDVPVKIDVGMGEAVLVVPPQVCVATKAQVGAGEVVVFERHNEGLDVDVSDTRIAAEGNPRVVLDADLGMGSLRVTHDDFDGFHDFRDARFRGDRFDGLDDENSGCRASDAPR